MADPIGIQSLGPSEMQAIAFLNRNKPFKIPECREIEFILSAPYCSDPHSHIGKLAVLAAGQFLKQHEYEYASGFLIAKLLRRVGNEAWISVHAGNWLSQNRDRRLANFVFQSLLAVSLDPSLLVDQIKSWFLANPTYHLAGGLFFWRGRMQEVICKSFPARSRAG